MIHSLAVIDASGAYGAVFHYSFVIALVGNAFFIFIYLWKKGRLDMDEEPKFQMMQEEEIESFMYQSEDRRDGDSR